MHITPPTIAPINAPDECWAATVLFIPDDGITTRLGPPTEVVYLVLVGTYTDA